MKLKRRGYILFAYWSGDKSYFEITEFCDSKKELDLSYNNHMGDKWDVEGRHKIHYFYLDIAKHKYIPLPKWKDDYKRELEYEQSEREVLSTKIF
jgi:hypothetical protein